MPDAPSSDDRRAGGSAPEPKGATPVDSDARPPSPLSPTSPLPPPSPYSAPEWGYGRPGPAPIDPTYGYGAAPFGQAAPGVPGALGTSGTPGAPWQPGPIGPRRSGLGLASLIVGGVGVLMSFVPFLGYLGILVGLVGLVLGIVALVQKGRARGLAIAGTITSGVALVLSIALSIFYTNAFVSLLNGREDGIGIPSPYFTGDPFDDGTTDDGALATGPGSRDQPLALGTTAEFADLDGQPEWEITPGASTLDATAIVAQDEFNDPAPAGDQYALLPLTVKYVGTASGDPFEITVQFVAADGTTHEVYDSLVFVDDDITDLNELYPDAEDTGNVVIAVPTDGVADGTWAISTFSADPVFYSAQ